MSGSTSGPQTKLHYAPNANITGSGQYAPGADGFNLADVSSVDAVNALPSGVEGLVWLGMENGATSGFQNAIAPFIGNSKVYGFYLADEPDPSSVSAASLKAESDWIHTHDPGAKTFIVEYNSGTPTAPSYGFTPANTDIDLFGLDPYPVRPASEGSEFSSGIDLGVINAGVKEAESIGVPLADIVPVYQAFGGGGYSSYTLPTASQEQQILSTWGSLVPTPAFDYAYSWGVQDGDTALVDDPALQSVFLAHNTGSGPPPPPPPSPDVLTATDNHGVTATVPVITSGTSTFTGPLDGTVNQSVTSGLDKVSVTASITRETLQFGAGTQRMQFIGSHSLNVTGGSGTDSLNNSSGGTNTFTAGTGSLQVTGGTGKNAYIFHAGDGRLTINDFSQSRGDTLTVDKSLQSSLRESSDGHGGSLLSFGSGHTIDLLHVASFPISSIHFV